MNNNLFDISCIQRKIKYWQDMALAYEKLEKHRLQNLLEQNRQLYFEEPVWICRGSFGCQLQKHNIICVSAKVQSLSGLPVIINISKCLDCLQYFINEISLQVYEEHYGVLLFDKTPHKSMTEYYNNGSREEKSRLYLFGYNVKSGALSTTFRRKILMFVMDSECGMFKGEVISHLEFLIKTNGAKQSNFIAKKKWVEDLAFVHDYNIVQQELVNGELLRK